MRLAVSNKEEGTQLFKDGNLQPAVARWLRALEHATKFVDLVPEDQPEVDALRLSLHLNICMAQLRLGGEESLRRAVASATEALAIDAANAKGLFRRASALVALKDFAPARVDLDAALAAEPEDGAVQSLSRTVDAALQEQDKRAKAVYSKMFS
jgi:peptidyl-prolyl isomerase D